MSSMRNTISQLRGWPNRRQFIGILCPRYTGVHQNDDPENDETQRGHKYDRKPVFRRPCEDYVIVHVRPALGSHTDEP